MKKILIGLIALVSFISVYSQDNDPSKYTWYRFLYGNKTDRLWAPKVIDIPADTVYSKDGISRINNVLYVGNGIKWTRVGVPPDSSIYATVTRLKDSMNAVRLALADTGQAIRSEIAGIDLQKVTNTGNSTTNSMYLGTTQGTTGGTIYFYGDSETAGFGLNNPNDRYATRVAKRLILTEDNRAVSGSTIQTTPGFGTGALNLATIATKGSSDRYLFFAFGVNDCRYVVSGYDTVTFKDVYQKAIDTAIARGWSSSNIILITPFYFGTYVFKTDSAANSFTAAGTQQRLIDFGTAVKTLGSTNGIKVIDAYAVMIANAGNNLLQYDSLHLNIAGSALIANSVLNNIYIPSNTYQKLAVRGISEFEKIRLNGAPLAGSLHTPVVISDSGYLVPAPNKLILNYETLSTNPINSSTQGGNINVSGRIIANGANFSTLSEKIITTGGLRADSLNTDYIGNKTNSLFRLGRNSTPYIDFNANKAISVAAATASGTEAFGVGQGAQATGNFSIALSAFSLATAANTFAATGGNSTATFATSFAGGKALGNTSFAFGSTDTASGTSSVSFGGVASGNGSFTINSGLNKAKGVAGTAFGIGSFSLPQGAVVTGTYNDTTGQTINSNNSTDVIFNIGNGTANNSRSTALSVQRRGWLGVGLYDPLQALHVKGKARIDTIPTGSNTDSVAVIFNGVIYKIARSWFASQSALNDSIAALKDSLNARKIIADSLLAKAIVDSGDFRIVGDIRSYQSGAIYTSTRYSYNSGGFENLVQNTSTGRYETIFNNLAVSSSDQSIVPGNDYVFTGTTATYTLPAISADKIGRHFSVNIKNRGSGNITVNSNSGGNDIYDTGATNTITITPGQAITLLPDGAYFNVL